MSSERAQRPQKRSQPSDATNTADDAATQSGRSPKRQRLNEQPSPLPSNDHSSSAAASASSVASLASSAPSPAPPPPRAPSVHDTDANLRPIASVVYPSDSPHRLSPPAQSPAPVTASATSIAFEEKSDADIDSDNDSDNSDSDDIPQYLKCGICLDLFVEPVTLTCGHSFCKFCMDISRHNLRNGSRNDESECAVCRAPLRTLQLDREDQFLSTTIWRDYPKQCERRTTQRRQEEIDFRQDLNRRANEEAVRREEDRRQRELLDEQFARLEAQMEEEVACVLVGRTFQTIAEWSGDTIFVAGDHNNEMVVTYSRELDSFHHCRNQTNYYFLKLNHQFCIFLLLSLLFTLTMGITSLLLWAIRLVECNFLFTIIAEQSLCSILRAQWWKLPFTLGVGVNTAVCVYLYRQLRKRIHLHVTSLGRLSILPRIDER